MKIPVLCFLPVAVLSGLRGQATNTGATPPDTNVLAQAAIAPTEAGPLPQGLPDKLDLKAAIFYALDHNYSILQAREVIRQQEGVILQIKAQEIPNVGATGSYQRNQSSISTTNPAETSLWSVEVKATQVIYAGGGVDSSVKSAKLVRDAAVFDLETVVNAAVLDVRTRFYTVLLTHEQVGVQEENVRLFQRELQDARNQFHAGTVSNFEVLRAQVSLANAQPDLIAARNNYRNAIEQLRQSLGVPSAPRGVAQSFPEIVGTLGVTAEAFDLESALAAAREHRPELLRLGKLQNAGEENVTTARSTYYPTLAAFAGYEGGGASLVNNTNPFLKGWLAGVQSNWAIFDGRATAGRVRQAKSLVEQTRLSYASVELAIDVEVRQALSALQEAAELVAASKQTIAEAEEALRLANARYHAGSATQLDVLTSQVALTQARTNALLANYQYSVALAALHKAMGIGDAPSRE